MSTCWFPDNSIIINFAVIDRLDLLRTALHGQARVVEAVAYEIRQSQGKVPHLGSLDVEDWFGKPIRLKSDGDREAVEQMRLYRFGGESDKPRQHLGESQTLHIIRTKSDYASSVWLTEDREAYRLAQGMQIVSRDTRAVLEELVAHGELSAQEGFEIAVEIDRADRPVLRMPTSVKDLEP